MLSFFNKENDYGIIEYKLYINKNKKDRLLSQCFYRIREGNGKAIYIIGITDKGQLAFKNIKPVFYSVNKFINIIKSYCKYKLRFFIHKSYVYAIITIYNANLTSFNYIDYDKI